MQHVPATDDFSITWPDPSMAESSWIGDRMHFPEPTVPLAQYLVGGFQERILSAPTIFANGYEFSLPPTLPDPPPDVVAGGLNVWHNDYSPRIRRFCDRVRQTDFDAMSISEVAAALAALTDEALECLRLTMVVITTFMQPTFELIEFLEEELDADAGLLSGSLIQGAGNASAASGSGLQSLIALATESPEIAAALAARNYEELDRLPGGHAFLMELSRFLDDFGFRAETWGSMHLPTWGEDQSRLLALLARYLTDPDSSSAALAHSTTGQRSAALAEVEARLDSDELDQFHALLEATSHHIAVSEDRARWQLSAIGVIRLPALTLGRKLVAAGTLDTPDDIFYLTWDEAQRATTDPGEWVRTVAGAGRAAFTHQEQLSPPPLLGPAPDPSSFGPDQPQVMRYFFGVRPPSVTDGVITGHPASRGTVTGRARVIRHLDESDRLEPGDILVCVTTAPPWTALFAIAAAVVTDTGGVMSHSAICAREFAIPCVVGT